MKNQKTIDLTAIHDPAIKILVEKMQQLLTFERKRKQTRWQKDLIAQNEYFLDLAIEKDKKVIELEAQAQKDGYTDITLAPQFVEIESIIYWAGENISTIEDWLNDEIKTDLAIAKRKATIARKKQMQSIGGI